MTPAPHMANSDTPGARPPENRSFSPTPVGSAIDSQLLLQGGKEALIAHNGVTYRLQATRQGKLILIK